MDAKLARCIYEKNGVVVGMLKAVGAWLMVTVNPYSYIVWKRPEGSNDR